MTESISVTVSDPWKCQEDLREKLIPGRMKAQFRFLLLKQVCSQ